jgi:hypothetical protein
LLDKSEGLPVLDEKSIPVDQRYLKIPKRPEEIAAGHIMLAAADHLSRLANVVPETRNLKEQYLEAQEAGDSIKKVYQTLGNRYIAQLREAAKWIAEQENPISLDLVAAQLAEVLNEDVDAKSRYDSNKPLGVSIALCKTRTEDLYISSQASSHFIDHPLLEALAGQIDDEDERTELAEVFRLWGDKVETLLVLQKRIVSKLKEAKSTTIDTDLRQLSEWLKSDFKEPFPNWKYPLAPVEAFEDSGITVSMKFYVDNVRMDRYLRSFNAFTQIRLRIYERFNNAGILIPIPQRDVNFSGPVKLQIESHIQPQGDGSAKSQQDEPAKAPVPR